jgi:trimethylamine--corrinoid protein Co-methyltransferase
MTGVNDVNGLKSVMEMALMVANGNPRLKNKAFFSIIASFAISPLKLSTTPVKIAAEAARMRIPVALSCAPMAGSTSPITMAGTLAQIHAEQLAGIIICQLTNPGAPVIYGGIPGLAELRTMGYEGGAVECGMMNAAIHQLASHIRVPNYNSSGLSDSKVPDAQAGWEKALTTILAAMGGSNYIHHAAGMLESMLTVSYEQYVMDDEIIGNCRRVLKGIEVDDEHLALDVINQVGPGGNFIAEEHTMDHMRSEYFQGNGVADRSDRDTWIKNGQKDARTRAVEMAKAILAKPEWSYISEEADRHIRERFNILL